MCIDIIYLCILKGFICLKYFFFFQAAKEDGLGNEEEAKGLAEEKHAGESGEETEGLVEEYQGQTNPKKRKLAIFACPCCNTPAYLTTTIRGGDVVLSLESHAEYKSHGI